MDAITLAAEATMSKKLDKAHYRVSEVAELTGVPYVTLHYWIQEKRLKTDGRFGISPRSPHKIPVSEVQRIIDAVE